MNVERRTFLPIAVLLVPASLYLASCTSVLGIESDRRLVADDNDSGAPDWSCLGRAAPTDVKPSSLQISFVDPTTASVSDSKFAAGTPWPGMTVRACGKLDSACKTPLSLPVTSGADGRVEIIVNFGFDGFFEASSDKTLPGLIWLGPEYGTETATAPFLTATSLAYVASSAGVKIDDTQAQIFALSLDCNGKTASGISLTATGGGPGTTPFYFSGGLPSITGRQTDNTGTAGYYNMPPGQAIVTATIDGTDRELSKLAVLIRAGTVSYVTLRPLNPNAK